MIGEIHGATGHPIRLICNALEVPRSSYYHAATPTPTQLTDQVIGERIEAIFLTHRRRYGYRRIHSDLSDEGLTCAPARVRRLMQDHRFFSLSNRTARSHCCGRAVNLATTYSRGTYRPTTIGAAAFHFRVRDGNGWFHRAMVTRGGAGGRSLNDKLSQSSAPAMGAN